MEDIPFSSRSSDEELVAAIRSVSAGARKDRAEAILLDRYRSRIFAWCLRYRPEREEALDLTQEVLIKVFNGLQRFERRSRFSSWVFAVTRNECLKSLRDANRFREGALDPDLLPAPEADPERLLLERLAEQDMLDLITRTLEPLEREALWLRCFDRLPVAAITEILAIADRTGARAVLQKARRKLRAALAENEQPGGENHG